MGLNDTASGERLHIGFFGMRNAGKSSLVNAVTGQSLSATYRYYRKSLKTLQTILNGGTL